MSFKIDYRHWPPPEGDLQYGPIPWDSEVFGFPFYQLEVPASPGPEESSLMGLLAHLQAESSGECLVFTKVDATATSSLQTLTRAGFYPVETMLEPYRALGDFQYERRFPQLRLRPMEKGDRPRLIEIAAQAFVRGRYHLDPHLSDQQAGKRYANWVEYAWSASELVLVYEDQRKGAILGFCHFRPLGDGLVDFSLAAIEPKYQQAGIGALMYAEALLACQARGYRQMVTHISVNNTPVLNIYAHLGFLFRHPRVTLHWYSHHPHPGDGSLRSPGVEA